MNHLPLIIKREYLTKVKNKSFIVMTFLSPLIMIALIAVVAYLSQLNNDKQRTISVLDETGYLNGVFQNTDNTTYSNLNDLSLEEAIKAYTINAAYVMRQEDVVGSIEVGKEADFIVLDRNPFEIETEEIYETQVLRTYLQGELIYEK